MANQTLCIVLLGVLLVNFTNGDRFIYVLREGTNPRATFYKIGRTSGIGDNNYRNVQRRMSNLQTGNPRELQYQCSNGNFQNRNLFRVNDNQAVAAERRAYQIVANFRPVMVNGRATEWVRSSGQGCPCTIVRRAIRTYLRRH